MNRKLKIALTYLAALVAFTPLAVRPARAQAPTFGVVDLQKCIDESKANQQAAAEFDGFQKTLNGTLGKLSVAGVAYLTPGEIRELVGLYEKAQPTDADKKRVTELEGKSEAQLGAMKKLESTNPLSDDQKKQLQALTDSQQTGLQALQEIQRAYQKRLEDKNGELSSRVTKAVREAIAKTAKDKGLTLVFAADQVLYAQVDITEDVLKAVK